MKLRYSIGGNLVERNINTLPASEFPPVPIINQPSIPLEPGFGLALRQALECCSEDSSRYILQGACLDVRETRQHYVVGTNGRYLFSANSLCFDLKQSIVIPDSKFLEWTDFLDQEPSSLSLEPGVEAEPSQEWNTGKGIDARLGETRIWPMDLHHQGNSRRVSQLEAGDAHNRRQMDSRHPE